MKSLNLKSCGQTFCITNNAIAFKSMKLNTNQSHYQYLLGAYRMFERTEKFTNFCRRFYQIGLGL